MIQENHKVYYVFDEYSIGHWHQELTSNNTLENILVGNRYYNALPSDCLQFDTSQTKVRYNPALHQNSAYVQICE